MLRTGSGSSIEEERRGELEGYCWYRRGLERGCRMPERWGCRKGVEGGEELRGSPVGRERCQRLKRLRVGCCEVKYLNVGRRRCHLSWQDLG